MWNSSIVESMPKAKMVAINVSIIKSTMMRTSISNGSSVRKRLNKNNTVFHCQVTYDVCDGLFSSEYYNHAHEHD